MYLSTVTLLLAASGVKATAVLAQRAPAFNLVARDVSQGWSIQASSAPAGTTSCGNGAYCPSSLHCNTAANDEVAACCSSSSDCRGTVEGAPKCADSSWDLYVGYMGNGFCCEPGLVGAYDTSKNVAGTCVASVGALKTAVLTSSGSGGAAATSAASSASSSASSASSESTASVTSAASASSKSESSASSKATDKTASTTATTTSGSSSTGSATSTSAAVATANGAEKVGMGFGLIGAAFLAVAAL